MIVAYALAAVVLLTLTILHWPTDRRRRLRYGTLASVGEGVPRSPKWPAVRRHFLALHLQCSACGTSENLEVHHITPYHVEPARELDPRNLIVLCEHHGCHLAYGHCFDWHAWNPHVREDALTMANHVYHRRYQEIEA